MGGIVNSIKKKVKNYLILIQPPLQTYLLLTRTVFS